LFKYSKFGKCGLVFLLLATLGGMFLPLEILAAPAATKGDLAGTVYLADLSSPLADAVVKIRSVKEGKVTQSEPTDKSGNYRILGIDEGQYTLGVSAKNGDYNLEVMIQIKGGETGTLSLVLKEGRANAVLARNAPKKGFFATPLGIALLAGIGAAAVVGGVSMINPSSPPAASPSKK